MKTPRALSELAALPDDACITDHEVAHLLNVTTKTIKRWDRVGGTGLPKATQFGARIRRRRLGDLREFIRGTAPRCIK